MAERFPIPGDLASREEYETTGPDLITLKMGAIFSIEALLDTESSHSSSRIHQSYIDGTIIRELNVFYSDDDRPPEKRREERVIFANGENLTSVRLKRRAYLSDVAIRAIQYKDGILRDSFHVSLHETVDDDETQVTFATNYSLSRFTDTFNVVNAEVARSNLVLSRPGRSKEVRAISEMFQDELQTGMPNQLMTRFDLRDFQQQLDLITRMRQLAIDKSRFLMSEDEYDREF